MSARIYQPAKTAMQSGKGKSRNWVLEFDSNGDRWTEPLMGYTATSDTLSQVKLKFDSKEDAVRYAENQGIEYRISEPKQTLRRTMSYSDNFNYDRKIPWTH